MVTGSSPPLLPLVSTAALLATTTAISDQMRRGLRAEKSPSEHSLLMLPSFVDRFADELPAPPSGRYFAIDLGGTSLRIARVVVRAGASPDVWRREWAIPEPCYDTDNGQLLAWVVERFTACFPGEAMPVIGLCYSFACRQNNIDHGEQIMWTKRFRGTGLLGMDVVQALRDEFAKAGIDAVIPALMNDSVASLVGAQFVDPRVQAAVILGTGTNCALVEDVRNVETLPAAYRKHGERMIINTEWGDCALPKGDFAVDEDGDLDRQSANPGHGLFEKLVAGLYIGDVSARILRRIALDSETLQNLRGIGDREGAFDGAVVSAVYNDTSEDLGGVARVLEAAAGVRETTYEERSVVRDVCIAITTRSARLCAAAIAAVACRVAAGRSGGDKQGVVISVDGSTFTKFAGYRDLVEAALAELREAVGPAMPPVELTLADGSSATGAAVCAAVFADAG